MTGKRTNQTRNRKQTNAAIRTAFNGRALRVNPDPTPTVPVPWNSIVLTGNSGNGQWSHATLVSVMHNDGVLPVNTETTHLTFRLLEARIWSVSANDDVIVDFYDLTDIDAAERTLIHTASDSAGRNHWAAVGYEWPRSQQLISFDARAKAFMSIIGRTEEKFIVKIKCLWRFDLSYAVRGAVHPAQLE